MFDLRKLKNGKYYSGKFKGFKETKGWFLGAFMGEASPLNTSKMEMLYKDLTRGDLVKPHYHKHKIELLIFLTGKAKYKVNDEEVILEKGDFLFVDVNNIISGEFLEKSSIFAIHSPSIPEDKTMLEE
jgi:mannose-6-phosphate isomerase-like protein (cupin superfamily)